MSYPEPSARWEEADSQMESGYRMARLNFYLQTYQIICKEVTLLGIDLEAELRDLRGGWISRVS
jgi:hypothetical protein